MPERRLRIAQVAPIAGPVRPKSGHSVEHLVWLLTEELVRRGHDVTLFATGDSETSANLQARYSRGYDADDDLWSWEFHESLHVAAAFERAATFDVIHCHAYHFGLPFVRLTPTPTVHTYHILPDDDIVRAYAAESRAHVAAISDYQRGFFGGVSDVTVVHHGIEIDEFPFGHAPGKYLLYLGRMIPDKGPREAIEIARRIEVPLVLAGGGDNDYFRAEIAPLVDGTLVRYAGPVGVAERNDLLAGAATLLYPVTVPEPFGLVLIEAMACGTPVAALRRGAVPEIVEHGRTGLIADDLETMASLQPATMRLDRAEIRNRARERFDYRRMADDYLAMYSRLANGGPEGFATAADGAWAGRR